MCDFHLSLRNDNTKYNTNSIEYYVGAVTTSHPPCDPQEKLLRSLRRSRRPPEWGAQQYFFFFLGDRNDRKKLSVNLFSLFVLGPVIGERTPARRSSCPTFGFFSRYYNGGRVRLDWRTHIRFFLIICLFFLFLNHVIATTILQYYYHNCY